MNWRIWYIDGIVDGSTPDDWNNAPSENVLAIAVFYGLDSHGTKLQEVYNGSDWYWMYNGNIYQNGKSTYTKNFWVDNPAPTGAVSKKGKYTTDEQMNEVCNLQLEWIS